MHAEIEDLESMIPAMGSNLCLDLLLSERNLEAEKAPARGSVHRLVEPFLVEETAHSLAGEIADGAPLAARWHKRVLRTLAGNAENASHLAEEALRCYSQSDF